MALAFWAWFVLDWARARNTIPAAAEDSYVPWLAPLAVIATWLLAQQAFSLGWRHRAHRLAGGAAWEVPARGGPVWVGPDRDLFAATSHARKPRRPAAIASAKGPDGT